MISPVAGFPRCALNDERVGHPHPIGIADTRYQFKQG